MKQAYTFPKDFYWGAATSSYQVEGGIEKTDWSEAAREGRVPLCGEACDHFNRYEEDFDIAKSLGHNAHRFSIEWSRIEPQEGVFDEEALAHYVAVLKALHKRNIEPHVTLWHWTLPIWFSTSGGFFRSDASDIFARYCARVVEAFGQDCRYYATINEPMVVASQGYLVGQFPPFKRVPLVGRLALQDRGKDKRPAVSLTHLWQYFKMERVLVAAHRKAYRAIKKVNPQTDVCVVKHTVYFHANDNPLNKLKARFMNWWWTYRLMNRLIDTCDSIGLNYYQHKKYGDTATYDYTDMGWQIYPEGIEGALKLLWRYEKPIYVSEAGCADQYDTFRAEYIKQQVQAVARAMADGVDVRGHLYWSLFDNYEWALGYTQKFGLVAIDFKTQARTIRPSASVYKQICEQNSIVIE